MKKRLGIITIGQSPRNDFTSDIKHLLSSDIIIKEKGLLDSFTLEESESLFRPKGMDFLVSRMRDGKAIYLDEKKVRVEIQNCVWDMEKETDWILLLCTGNFDELQSSNPLLIPQNIIHNTIRGLCRNKKISIIIPDKKQESLCIKWWDKNGIKVIASEYVLPYAENANHLKLAAKRLDQKPPQFLVMDCMGFSTKMKKIVQTFTKKTVILPRTMIIRIINEMV